ncbi:MAG: hypothetical protein ACFFFT_10215 [Candidatus Thorarchaeota archaeon]
MKQVMVDKDSLIELEELYIILLQKTSKDKQKDTELTKRKIELHELFKNLNPRYFGEVIQIKEAREIPHTSDIVFSSKFNAFRVY